MFTDYLNRPDLKSVFRDCPLPDRVKKQSPAQWVIHWRDSTRKWQTSKPLTKDAAALYHRRQFLRLLSFKWGPEAALQWGRSCPDARTARAAAHLRRELIDRPARQAGERSAIPATPKHAPAISAALNIHPELAAYLATPSAP